MLYVIRRFGVVLLTGVLLCGAVDDVLAQRSGQTRDELEGVGIDRQVGEAVPGDLVFTDANGDRVHLRRYFDGDTPVVLNLVYHSCPMLCGLMLDGFTRSLQSMEWTPGEEFRVLTVSFNYREGPSVARDRKETYLDRISRADAEKGWHFLTGDEDAVQGLLDAVGFRVRWISEDEEYAHPTAQIFLSGEGTITRYIYGIDIPSGDMRKALVEASNGELGNTVDRAAMYCFQFDPEENTYTADAFNLMKVGGVLTFLLLGGILFVFWRREHRELEKHEQWEEWTPAAS